MDDISLSLIPGTEVMIMLIETMGWMGSLMLAVCGFPQAWMSWKQGHSRGVSSGLLWLWGGGEVLALGYVIALGNAPLIVNYLCNLVSVSIIVWYKLVPRH